MGFPPFRGAVRQIILASVAIYVVILLSAAFAPAVAQAILTFGVLDPAHIRQGWLWQLVTYPFTYVDPLQFALSLLGIYFLGGAVEDQIGSARFYGLFFGSVILSGLAGFVLSLTGVLAQGTAMGSGAAANAILMVFYMFFRGAVSDSDPNTGEVDRNFHCCDRDCLSSAESLCVVLFCLAAWVGSRVRLVFGFS